MRLAKVSMLKPMCIYFNLQVYAIDVRNHGHISHQAEYECDKSVRDCFFFSFRTHTHVWLFQCIVGGAKVSKK